MTTQPHSHVVSVYWGIWASVTLTAFLVPELWMLIAGRAQDTLSANVWRAEEFLPGQAVMHWTFIHFALIAVLFVFDVWLLGHFGWGLWR